MEHRTRGIILRTRPLTETSLIVHWLTPDLGRISTVAKGARRAKSTFRGKLDLFFTGDFTFVRSRRSDLHTLREVVVLQTRPIFRKEMVALQRGCYATAFLEQVTEVEAPTPELAQLFEEFIDAVGVRPAAPELVLAFELRMLGELGLTPDLGQSGLSEGARKVAEHLARTDWDRLAMLKPTLVQLREVRHFLQRFIMQHLARIPRGRETLWSDE